MVNTAMNARNGAREDGLGLRTGLMVTTAVGMTLAAAFGAPASAQEPDKTAAQEEDKEAGQREKVTVIGKRNERDVTSPKATAPVLDTPQTITVIPSEVITQQGSRNLTDVLRNTPGITFSAGENGFASGVSNFNMRGFDASANIFIDGVRDSGNYSRDAFNIDRVEVFKGPAGDNGRGGAGGYVNIVTKTPLAEALYSGKVSYGFDEYDSDARGRASVDVNQPFGDNAAVRLNLLWEDGGVAGRDIASRETLGFAPSLAFGVGTPTLWTFSYQYVRQDDVPDWGVPAALIDGMFRRDPVLDAESLRDKFFGLASDFDEVIANAALARIEHAFSPSVELSSQLRWSQTEREAAYTIPTGYTAATQIVATQRQAYARENQNISSLTNLTIRADTGSLKHTIATGIEFSWEDSEARAFPTPTGGNVPIANPDPWRLGAWTQPATQRSEVSVSTIAAYLYDTVELSPQWEITGGLRVESYDVEIDHAAIPPAPPIVGANGLEISETTVSGKIGLVYKPVENASLYGSFGVSALPPASFLSNPDISREGDNAFPGFSSGINSSGADVQKSVNYEIGGKWDLFDKRLSATAALFRTERQNVAITGKTGPLAADPVVLVGYGEQIAQGLEVGLAGYITPAWYVFGGALFLDTERQHNPAFDLARCWANPGDFGAANAAACNATHGTNGDELAFSPEFTANFWTTYRFPFGLTIGGGAQYVGDSWAGRPDDAERHIPNGIFGELPSYFVMNALLAQEITPNATVRLNVDNVTDEVYAVSTNWPAQRVLLGAPRSFLLSVDFRYGYEQPPVPPLAAAEPPPPPPPAPKQFIVFFGFNKCNITAEADAVLSEAASAAKSSGSASVRIVGHTDTVGSAAYNQKLSECRADAAKANLVGKGIADGSISTSGRGESELMVQTGDGVKEPQNRRATVDLQ